MPDPKPSMRPYIKISLDKIIEQHGDRILGNEKAIDDWRSREDERNKQATKNNRWVGLAVTVALSVAAAGITAYFDVATMKRDIQTLKNGQALHNDKHITSDKVLDIENEISECRENAETRFKELEKLHPRRRTK